MTSPFFPHFAARRFFKACIPIPSFLAVLTAPILLLPGCAYLKTQEGQEVLGETITEVATGVATGVSTGAWPLAIVSAITGVTGFVGAYMKWKQKQ